jgi:hypothetical protein
MLERRGRVHLRLRVGERANTIARSAIFATSSRDSTPGAETPMNTSAPITTFFLFAVLKRVRGL